MESELMPQPPVPPAELSRRMIAFRDVLHERKLTAALIVDEKNVRYLSGFTGGDSALLITKHERFLLTDFRYIPEAQATARGWTIVTEPPGIMDKAGKLARKHHVRVLAIEPGAMRLTDMKPLRKAAGKIKFREEHCMVAELRLRKSPFEVECLEGALRIQETCFLKICAELKDGISEREAAARLRYLLVMEGADDQAFNILFQFGANSSLPHGLPTRKTLSGGNIVLADWGAKYRGYHSDLTRTFFWGKIDSQLHQIHNAVLAAHDALIAAIAPGVELAELSKIAHVPIDAAGYKDRFCHATGHGIGLDIHEQPAIAEHTVGALAEGMVLAIEPGVYLPGVAGVRVEDVVLVTKTGCRVLSRLKHGLRWDGRGE